MTDLTAKNSSSLSLHEQSIFIGVFIIGGLGAAGVLSAASAAVWTNTGDILYNSDNIVASPKFQILASLHCYRAARFLIGTSV